MKWLEMIKVQVSSGQEITAQNELISLVSDIQQNPDYPSLLEFVIYRHAMVPGYFSIHLLWNSQHPQIRGSVAALNLAQTLKTCGLVDHSVWMETM
jgi:hypothetical protein